MLFRSQKRPRRVRNEPVDGTNSPCRDRAPECPRGEQEPPRAVEGDSDRANAVNGGGCDGERTRSKDNERDGGTNAPSGDTGPGGHRGEEESSRGVEGESDRVKVVDRAGYDGNHPRCEENERGGDANPPSRDNRPGGHSGERDELGDVEGDRERQSDGDGDDMDGRPGGKDGATSGARRDSKRVKTTPLAGGKPGQYRRRKRGIADVPEASTPPTIDPRRATDQPNPPRRRGRLKTRPRRISTRKWTYQVTRTRRGRIGRIGPFGDIVHGL